MKTHHFGDLEEARRVWQPRYKNPLTEVELMEICFNSRNLLNFIIQIHQRRVFEGDLRDD